MPTIKTLPTCRHTKIGSKSHKPKTATAHMTYILRAEALTEFQAENMPDGGRGTRVYFDKQAEGALERQYEARICEKMIIALPLELNREQRHEVVARFMQEIGKGKIAWCAAHHDANHDEHNPHAHVVFRDADITDPRGRKVIGFGQNTRDIREAEAKGWKIPPRMTSGGIREAWSNHLNGYMREQGIDIQYDHRSHEARGLAEKPQIHIGVRAQEMAEKGADFTSMDRDQNGRTILYSLLDHGSRNDINQQIIASNAEMAGQGRGSAGALTMADLDGKRVEREAMKEADRLTKPAPQIATEPARDGIAMKPLSREETDKAELRDIQRATFKTMLKEQKADRDALRMAQDAEKAEHRLALTALYQQARVKAYAETRAELAPKYNAIYGMPKGEERNAAGAAVKEASVKKWQALTGMPRGDERDAATAALKADTAEKWKKLGMTPRGAERETAADALKLETAKRWEAIRGKPRGQERDDTVTALKAETEAAWLPIRGMKPSAERDAAAAALKAETKTVYNEKAAPLIAAVKVEADKRFAALKEQQFIDRGFLRGQHQAEMSALAKQQIGERLAMDMNWRAHQIQRLKHSMDAKPSMVAVQAKALRLMKLQNVRMADGTRVAVPTNPAAAVKIYQEQAASQQNARATMRDTLTGERQFNLLRGSRIVPDRDHDGMQPRGRPRTQKERANAALQRVQANDQQSKTRYAAHTGRRLTDADLANASPEVKAKVERDHRAARARSAGSLMSPSTPNPKDKAKGKNGGRSGR